MSSATPPPRLSVSRIALACSLLALSSIAFAQAPLSADAAIEELRQQERLRLLREQFERGTDVRLPHPAPAAGKRLPVQESPCFRIDTLALAGAEPFPWLAAAATGPESDDSPLGRCLGTEGINTVLARLQQALVARGWITSRVLAPPQELSSGQLKLSVVPGRIAAIRTASHLRGYAEVAGQRAEVVIANPSGIQVDGAGFINTSRATLTTGTPQFGAAGSLESFLVQGGTIGIEGAGLAVNGILNDAPRAGQLAYQNAPLDNLKQKPDSIVLMHIPPAQTTLGELMAAAYETQLAAALGYTNADIGYADLLEGRGQQTTVSMGHSRGTIVQANAFDILHGRGFTSKGLSADAAGIAVSTERFIASAEKVIVKESTDSRLFITYMANDAISVIAAGNPGDAWAALKEFYNVVTSDNSAHSCYGTGAKDCVTIANPVPGGPVPTGQQPGNIRVHGQGALLSPLDRP